MLTARRPCLWAGPVELRYRQWLLQKPGRLKLCGAQHDCPCKPCHMWSPLLQGPGSGELVTAQITQCVPANPAILDAVPDLTSLTYLNEPSILHDLNQRCASV